MDIYEQLSTPYTAGPASLQDAHAELDEPTPELMADHNTSADVVLCFSFLRSRDSRLPKRSSA